VAGEQVVGLEYEADFAVADGGEPVMRQPGDICALEGKAARGWPVEKADQVHQRGLAGARGAHDGDELEPGPMANEALARAVTAAWPLP
jgi:hypothetical protein